MCVMSQWDSTECMVETGHIVGVCGPLPLEMCDHPQMLQTAQYVSDGAPADHHTQPQHEMHHPLPPT